MGVATIEERLLAALAAQSTDGGCSVPDLVATVTSDSERLSEQVEVAVTIEDLVEQGLLERQTAPNGREHVALTEAGSVRAVSTRDDLASTDIELVEDDTRQTATLSAAAAREHCPVAAMAAQCTDDGVYYRQASPPEGVVGREQELAAFEAVVDRCRRQETGELVVFSGPGGIGKTTLLEECLAALPDGVDCTRVTCQPSRTQPYGPVRDMLDQTDGVVDPFADVGPAADDTENVAAQQTALFHDVTAALLPESATLRVLALDDADLADSATLSYLDYLVSELSSLPLVVVLTHEPGGFPDEGSFSAASSPEGAPVTRLALGTLGPEETGRLVEQVVGARGVPAAFTDAVHETTDGTPLFVESTVEALLDSGQLDPAYQWYPDSPAAISLPDAVHETITRQLQTLDETGRTVLQWVAIAGESIAPGVLRAVADQSPETLATTVEVLVESGFLDRDEQTGQLTIRNNVVREAVLEQMDDRVRVRYHATIAESIETVVDADDGGTQRAASIASHYRTAGQPARAIEWHRTAAEHARELYAHEGALEQYELALDVAREAGATEQLLATGEQLAATHLAIGEYETAQQYVQFVRERTDEDDTDRRQQLALLAGRIDAQRGRFEQAFEAIHRGLALDTDDDDRRCQLLLTKSINEVRTGEFDAATATVEEVHETAERLGDREAQARAIVQRGRIADRQSAYDRAREQYQDALAMFEEIGDRHEQARVQNSLGLVARKQGEFAEAMRFHEAALEGYRAVNDRHRVGIVNNNLGLVAWRQGTYDQAREYFEQALDTADQVQDRYLTGLGRLNLANVDREQGEFDDARRQYETAREIFEATGNDHLVAITRHDMGKLARRRGDDERAREQCQQALDTYESIGHRHHAAAVRNILGLIALDECEDARADALFEQALDTARAIENRSLVAKIRTNMARLALAQGRIPAAEEHLSAAGDGFAAVENRHGSARVGVLQGKATGLAGDTDAGRRQIEDAIEQLVAIGATYDVAIARYELGVLLSEAADGTVDESPVPHWRQAFEGFESMGAIRWAARAATRLAESEADGTDWEKRATRLTERADLTLSEPFES